MECIEADLWRVILNPSAGTTCSRKKWKSISEYFRELNIKTDVIYTQYAGHAVEIAKESIEKGFRHLLVVGGDGTLNEVVNGIFLSDVVDKKSITLALVPYGTGNDWARFWGLNNCQKKAVEAIAKGTVRLVDIGLSKGVKADGGEFARYFINAIGMGFDATVVKMTNRFKHYLGGGSWFYSMSVIFSLFRHRSCTMTIGANGKTVLEKSPVYTISVGNGCYTGGGLKQTPDAIPYDGIFHVTVVKQLSVKNILLGIKHLFSGTLLSHPCVETVETELFEVESEKLLDVESDGIILPNQKKLSVSILPQALSFVVN